MSAATFDFELLDGPHAPAKYRDEFGRPLVVFWVWRVRRRDAFGEWDRELQVETSGAGVFHEIRDEVGQIWPAHAEPDSAGPDRALIDALQGAIDGALAVAEFEVLSSQGER